MNGIKPATYIWWKEWGGIHYILGEGNVHWEKFSKKAYILISFLYKRVDVILIILFTQNNIVILDESVISWENFTIWYNYLWMDEIIIKIVVQIIIKIDI